MPYGGYRSKNIGPQEGELGFEEDEESPRGTHWYCRCGKRNRMQRMNCYSCHRSRSERMSTAFVDGPGQSKDGGDDPLEEM